MCYIYVCMYVYIYTRIIKNYEFKKGSRDRPQGRIRRIQTFEKGGARQDLSSLLMQDQLTYLCSQCVKHTGMRSMPTLGGLGHVLPGNFEKLHLLRLNLRAFLVIYQPLMFCRYRYRKLLKMHYLHAYTVKNGVLI